MCWTKAASNIMDDNQAAAVQKHLSAQTASRLAANTVPKSTDEAAAGIKIKRTARFLAMVLPSLGRTASARSSTASMLGCASFLAITGLFFAKGLYTAAGLGSRRSVPTV